jgi:hypothetical protein
MSTSALDPRAKGCEVHGLRTNRTPHPLEDATGNGQSANGRLSLTGRQGRDGISPSGRAGLDQLARHVVVH